MRYKGRVVNNRVTSYCAGDCSAPVRSDCIPYPTQILKGREVIGENEVGREMHGVYDVPLHTK